MTKGFLGGKKKNITRYLKTDLDVPEIPTLRGRENCEGVWYLAVLVHLNTCA